MKNEVLIFSESSIKTADNKTVMHRWEDPIMKRKSEWLCEQGGNILELGFGMGISANYIQSHNIKLHTICEINPYVLEKLYIWAENKPNVIVLEGDWFDRINDMEIYDGILFDTHNDKNITFFFTELIYKISRKNTRLTWWNNSPQAYGRKKPVGTEYEIIEVDPPQNDYFNSKQYFFPKYIFS
jgi:hypothetical protein